MYFTCHFFIKDFEVACKYKVKRGCGYSYSYNYILMSWRSPIVAEGNYLMGFKTLQGRKQHKKPSGYRNGREMELHSLAGKQIYKYFKLRIDGKFIYIFDDTQNKR